MADGPVCGAGLYRLSLRGAIARGFICVHGLFVTYEYYSPFCLAAAAGVAEAQARRGRTPRAYKLVGR